MNEITQLLAKPLPLGLMVVFFLVALAVFSLFVARIESRHRSVLAHYQDQLRAVHQGHAASWAGAQPASAMPARSGSWVGWLLSVGAVLGVGVALLWTQLPGAASVVVPDLARLPGLSAEPSAVAIVEPPAVHKPEEVSEVVAEPKAPAPVVQAALVPTPKAAATRPTVPAPVQEAPAQRRPRFQDDAEIERMLAWERRRSAQRSRLRAQQARAGQGEGARRAQRQRRAQAERQAPTRSLPSVEPRDAAKDRAANQPQTEQPQEAPKVVESPPAQVQQDEPALAQEPAPPRKRRKRLRLDRSGDPMGNI